jgi:hypothetical protein
MRRCKREDVLDMACCMGIVSLLYHRKQIESITLRIVRIEARDQVVLRAVVSCVSAEIVVKRLFDQFDDALMLHRLGHPGLASRNESCRLV